MYFHYNLLPQNESLERRLTNKDIQDAEHRLQEQEMQMIMDQQNRDNIDNQKTTVLVLVQIRAPNEAWRYVIKHLLISIVGT